MSYCSDILCHFSEQIFCLFVISYKQSTKLHDTTISTGVFYVTQIFYKEDKWYMLTTIKLPSWKFISNHAQFNLAEFGFGRNIENSGSIKSCVHINICISTSTYQIFQEYLLILTYYTSSMNWQQLCRTQFWHVLNYIGIKTTHLFLEYFS